MKQYRALRAFPYGNSHVDKGALVNLSDKQAAYLRTGGYIEPTELSPAPKKASGKAKAGGQAPAKTSGGEGTDGGKQ